ncbi:MAG: KH domain-containing protein [Candidatus Promineifilaceae bacterium]
MKELIDYVVKSLVDNPDQVEVTEVPGPSLTVLELSVAAEDMGRVIGKNGRIINAIRTLLQVPAAKQGTKVSLELLEADDNRR